LLETCRGFKQTYHRRNCALSWFPTGINRQHYKALEQEYKNTAEYKRSKLDKKLKIQEFARNQQNWSFV
jgi:hypothetical protein